MKKIDRLIQKAKKIKASDELKAVVIGQEEPDGDLIVTVTTKYRTETIRCKTKEQADKIIDDYAERWPPMKAIPVIFGSEEMKE